MRVEAYFCEWYDCDLGGCITYPVEITTERPECSYGAPVVVIDGEARGAGEMPPGELQIPEALYDELAPRLRDLGYLVCTSPVDNWWLECWENGEPVEHWHPEARLVSF